MITLHNGDCLEYMRGLDADSVDAVVTDPPAGISFMGKEWDDFRRSRNQNDAGRENVFGRTSQHAPEIGRRPRDIFIVWMTEIAAECLRVLKPGGYALVWALPRTSHWTATAWEDGGFEVRDRIAYVFGSGFPKSLDVSKAIDKAAGAEREVVGYYPVGRADGFQQMSGQNVRPWQDSARQNGNGGNITAPATASAREWAGWGTALKPAVEDWWVFRKPLSEATVAANVLRWGTGAMNIDAGRVGFASDADEAESKEKNQHTQYANPGSNRDSYSGSMPPRQDYNAPGRWPAHLILDGSPEVEAMFPVTTSGSIALHHKRTTSKTKNDFGERAAPPEQTFGDTGSAARFFKSCPLDEDDYPPLFYCAKASKRERDAGCEGLEIKCGVGTMKGDADGSLLTGNGNQRDTTARNHHPTVKPLSLMRYLITLVTREGATVLDPFLGSGSTGVAAVQLGRSFVGCDNDAEYFAIAQARIEHAVRQVAEAVCQDLLFAPRVEQLVEQYR